MDDIWPFAFEESAELSEGHHILSRRDWPNQLGEDVSLDSSRPSIL
jgi:hypothetical protein